MASVKATFTVRNDRSEEHEVTVGDIDSPDEGHGPVHVAEQRRREVTLSRELADAEDAVWAIESEEYQIVWDLWEHVEGAYPEGWGFRSPYPPADVSVSLDHEVSLHDVVWHIAQREGVEPPGVYLDLFHNRRIHGDHREQSGLTGRLRGLVQYLGAMGVDTSYWAHGHDGLTAMDERRFPDGMLDHAGYETE